MCQIAPYQIYFEWRNKSGTKIRKRWYNATCKTPTGTCNPIESKSG